MLLFRSEEQLAVWCARENAPRGSIITLAQTWELAQKWYANRLDPAYRGRTLAEAEAIFASLGLTSEFWQF